MTTDHHDTEQPNRERGPVVGCLAVAALVLPIVYVLSIGPAWWLYRRGYLSDSAAIVYAPLRLLGNNCKPIEDALRWYIDLWGQ